MNITKENKGNLAATLKIQLTQEDYNEKVDKALKDLQRKAQMPGFRPGKVPMGLIRKMYGKSVLADEVNKIMIDGIYDYIKTNELNILGSPLPDREMAIGIDWEKQTDFEFHYDIGIAPVIDLKLNDEILVEYYKIKIEDSLVENSIKDITSRHGKMISPETSDEDDILFGEFAEIDGEDKLIEGGLKNKSTLFVKYIKDEETRNNLLGKRLAESVDIDIVNSVENESEMASMLGIKKEDLEKHGKKYRFTIERISRIEPAELNADLYAKVAPEITFTSEGDFSEYMRNQLSKQYQVDADKHFKNEAIKAIVERANMELPEEFLKRWLIETNKDNDQITTEQVENEFVSLTDSFKWHLIESHIIKSNNIEVSTEEVIDYLKDYMRVQLKQYGQENPDDGIINNFVNRIMNNKEEVKKVYDQLYDTKILELLKENLKLDEKEVTFDEFADIMSERYKSKESKL